MHSPAISVLMPAYNAAPYIEASLSSILQQSFSDFEVVVVNDASTDGTRRQLSHMRDTRIRVIENKENLGIVGSLNRGFAAARGTYIARIDADDYCAPERLELQKSFLDRHPDVLLLGTGGQRLISGKLHGMRIEPEADPAILRWLFHILNPIGHSSMMFRRDAVLAMGEYLREEFRYAEDFEFSHRLLARGSVAMLPARLVTYRVLPDGLSRGGMDRVIAKAMAVLQGLYAPLLGVQAHVAASLVAHHVMAGQPVPSPAAFEALGTALDALLTTYLERHPLSPEQQRRAAERTAELWWQTVLATARQGAPMAAARGCRAFPRWHAFTPSPLMLMRAGLAGMLRRS